MADSGLHAHSKVPSKAFLVGINYRAWPSNQLRGCYTDVEEAEEFLIKIGMDASNIRKLTDQDDKFAPTKEAILDGFHWIREGAKDGDVLFIHYSGHGVEEEPPGDNPLGRTSSKALCPIDLFHNKISDLSKPWSFGGNLKMVNSIRGEDFYDIFENLPKSVNLTAVFDCCHSTGAMRALGNEEPPRQTPVRGIKVPAGHAKLLTKVARNVDKVEDIAAGATAEDIESTIDPRYVPAELFPEYVIGFAAAQGWEPAADSSANGIPCGAFSHFFYSLLNDNVNKINGKGAIQSVNNSLRDNRYTQTASLVTSADRATVPFFYNFGGSRAVLSPTTYTKLNNARDINATALTSQKFAIARKDGISPGTRDISTPPASPSVKRNGNGNASSSNGHSDDSNGHSLEADQTVRNHVHHIVTLCQHVASSPELQKLRAQDRGLFDSLLQHALPFALNAAGEVVKSLTGSRDINDAGAMLAIQQHLPTAINFSQQVMSLPEVQQDRGLFDSIFHTCMPIVLQTAQTLLNGKRGVDFGSSTKEEDEQRGFFDFVVNKILPTAVNVISNVVSGGSRDITENTDRGFLDVLKKVAPIVLQVATAAVNSATGQRSLAFTPETQDRGFFDKLKNFAVKVVNNPVVKKIGATALHVGMQVASSAISSLTAGTPAAGGATRSLPVDAEEAEVHARGFFGAIIQHLAPIAINVVQGAVGGLLNGGKRGLDGETGALIAVEGSQRGKIFDIFSKALPVVLSVAHQNLLATRGLVSAEDEALYLHKVLTTVSGPLIQAAHTRAAIRSSTSLSPVTPSTPGAQGERGISDIIGAAVKLIPLVI